MRDDVINRLHEMKDAKPIENPCPRMFDLGYNYMYRKGFVDKTDEYERVEEDVIIYTGKKYNIQFNLASRDMVLVMHEDNADYYGNKPTFFITNELLECIDEIVKKLGWRD